jgi:hypothetical protein
MQKSVCPAIKMGASFAKCRCHFCFAKASGPMVSVATERFRLLPFALGAVLQVLGLLGLFHILQHKGTEWHGEEEWDDEHGQ